MTTITADTMTALAADLTDAVKDVRRARLAIRESIRAIRDAGDWTATDHKSWTTFAADVVGNALPKSATATDWGMVAVALAEEGMSVRVISTVVGKSKSSVSNAVRAAILDGDAEIPEQSTGADGTQRKTSRGARSESAQKVKSAPTSAPSKKVTRKVSPYVAAIAAAKEAAQKVRRQHKDGAALTAAQKRAQVNALRAVAANLLQEAEALEGKKSAPAIKAA